MDRQGSNDKVVAHIDRILGGMLERPSMYAFSPLALELIFGYLDDLRNVAVHGHHRNARHDFYREAGLGSSLFTTRMEEFPHAKREEYLPLLQFLRKYIEQYGREWKDEMLPSPPTPDEPLLNG